MQWADVCSVTDLQENSGVCALVNGLQVAIFYLPGDKQCIYAIRQLRSHRQSQCIITRYCG